MNRIPIQLTPEIEDTIIAVTTRWQNANPQEIESEILDEQEKRLQSVSNLRAMTSISQRGQGQIRLEFRVGTPKEAALREVSDKLREVPSYPENVDEPVIASTDPGSQDFIAWVLLLCSDPEFDITTLFDVIERRVIPQFERLPGVAEVNLLGGREREAQIRVDPTRLAQRGLTISQFVGSLRALNENFSGGALQDGRMDVRVRAVGRFSDPREIEETVIARSDGGPVYIRDVADVVETYKERASFVRSRGMPLMAINFQREIGSNVLEVMGAIQSEIERMNAEGGVLQSVAESEGVNGRLRLIQTYDQTEYIYQALELVRNNIFLGGAIAVGVLLLFLRSLRSILIIGMAIPISIIGSIVVMYAMGRTVNVISLAGMAFAVGMVIDNAIVVMENIYRHMEMGKRVARAAYDGASEVAGAVLASTLTTMIVFVPILMIEEQAGQLFRDIAMAISAAVLLSFLVSMTVIPSALFFFLKNKVNKSPERGHETNEESGTIAYTSRVTSLSRLRRAFILFFTWPFYLIAHAPRILRHQLEFLFRGVILRIAVVLLFVTATVVGIVLLMPPVDYLPTGNRNFVLGIMTPPPGYHIDTLSRIGRRIEERIRPFWEAHEGVDSFFIENASNRSLAEGEERTSENQSQLASNPLPSVPISPGPDSPLVTPPPLEHYFFVGFQGRLFHGGASADPRRVVDMLSLFRHAAAPDVIPGFNAFAFQAPLFRLGGTTGSAVSVDLYGPDLGRVTNSANALYGALVDSFGPFSVQPDPSNFNILTPELQVYPDHLRLADLGLTMTDLGLAVQINSDGAFIGEYDMRDERVDLKVISIHSLGENPLEQIGQAPLAAVDGAVVTLDSVARLARVAEPDQIKRVARQRAVSLQLTPPEGMPLQIAIDQVNELIAHLSATGAITPDVEVELAGSASKLDDMKIALLGDGSLFGIVTSSLFLALLVVYLLMCVLFQSWTLPMVIMLSVPLATLGGFLGLSVVHNWSLIDRYMPTQNMDVLTILGFIILAGVVVNNAILLVHQSLNFMSGRSQSKDGQVSTNDPHRSIAFAVESRVRPILMSTLTSVGGMSPLILMPGAGSELYRGLGSVVVGGLLVSTIFTLILIPVVLSLVFDLLKYKPPSNPLVE